MVAPSQAPAGSPERPLRRDAERNRQRILAAAADLFAERGLGVALDDVAHRAGVGVGTVYRRFPDKDALIGALFEEQLDAVVVTMEEGLAHDDPWEGLVHAITRSVERQVADRGLKELFFSESDGSPAVAECRGRIAPAVRRLVRRAQESGQLRLDVEASDIRIVGLMLSGVGDAARNIAPEHWRRLQTIILDGLRVRRGEPSPLPEPALSTEEAQAAMCSGPSRR